MLSTWEAGVLSNPEKLCHVVGCGKPWIEETGALMIIEGGKRDDESHSESVLICHLHDKDKVVEVTKGGCRIKLGEW